jgi:hypothetical protein
MDRGPITRGFRVGLYAALPLALLVLLYADRRQWFFYDDWEFLATRGLGGQPLDLFRPHNAHWSTIPILVYRALYAVVGIRSYIPYLLVLLVLHLATAYVLWRVMIRLGADGWIATVLAIVFLLVGAGYQNLTWAFQIGYIAPLLLGFAAVMLADRPGAAFGRRDLWVWLLAVAGLMCSAIGITMVVFLALVALLRRGWRAAFITASVPAAVYLIWLLAIGRHYLLADSTVNAQTLLVIPDFVWAGLTATVDQVTGFVGIGAVAILGLLAWLVLKRRDAPALAPAFAGAIAALAFFIFDGIDRTAGGAAAATTSRYLYVSAALLLPITAVIMSSLVRRALFHQVVLVALAAFAVVHGVSYLFDQTRALGLVKQQEEQQILAAAALLRMGAPVIGTHPDDRWAPDLTTRDLGIMVREGKVATGMSIAPVNRLDAELALQVAVAPMPLVAAESPVTVTLNGSAAAPAPDGCVTTATGSATTATLQFVQSGWISVQSPGGGALDARLSDGSGLSDPFVLATPGPNLSVVVSDVAPSAQLVLTLAPDTMLCGNLTGATP